MFRHGLAYLALATLLGIASAHIYFGDDCTAERDCLQPPLLPSDHSLVLDAATSVDFSSVELSLARLKFDTEAQLLLDSRAESLLSSASASLDAELDAAQWRQIEMLITRSFPTRQSSILFDALQRFYAYFQAMQNQMSKISDQQSYSDEADSLIGVKKEVAQQALREKLQRRYLGEDFAAHLYAQQNTLARYLLELRLIDLDPAINADDKSRRSAQIEQALQDLMSDEQE